MRAAVHTRYGPPEVVEVSQVGKPAAGEHELLVKVHATGNGVTSFQVGDRVFGYTEGPFGVTPNTW